jgi:hypothetical protein
MKSNPEPLGEFSSRLLDMHWIYIEDDVDRFSMDKFRSKLEISREKTESEDLCFLGEN